MVRSVNEGKCPECGASLREHDTCSYCGAMTRSPALKALPPLDEGFDNPPRVKLVRELKMPSIDHLVDGADAQALYLEDALLSVEDAIGEGDLPVADRLLDGALGDARSGLVVAERRWRDNLIPFLLWVWCGILVLFFVASLLL